MANGPLSKNPAYAAYIESPAWLETRRRKIISARRCYACGTKKHLTVHHLTYERKGREDLDDLLVLCHQHHMQLHEDLAKRYPNLSLSEQIKHTFEILNWRTHKTKRQRKRSLAIRKEARKAKIRRLNSGNNVRRGKGQSMASVREWNARCKSPPKPLKIFLAPLPEESPLMHTGG